MLPLSLSRMHVERSCRVHLAACRRSLIDTTSTALRIGRGFWVKYPVEAPPADKRQDVLVSLPLSDAKDVSDGKLAEIERTYEEISMAEEERTAKRWMGW